MSDRLPVVEALACPSEKSGGVLLALPLSIEQPESLLHAMRAGQKRAILVFYDGYAQRIEQLLRRMLGPDADVDVALNETFLRALRKLDSVYDPHGLLAWLYNIAVFVVRETWASRKKRRWLLFRPTLELPAIPQEDGATSEVIRRIHRHLARFEDTERAALCLRFFQEMDVSEIAEALSVPLATMRRHLQKAEGRFYAMCANDEVLKPYATSHARRSSESLESEEE